MTLHQTVTIPADRRLQVDLPETFSPGTAQLTITRIDGAKARKAAPSPKAAKPRLLTQAEFDAGLPCPMDHSKPNAVTIAAMKEVQDMIDGKIPSKSMTVEEFLKELHR
jgi:hypothetical protein